MVKVMLCGWLLVIAPVVAHDNMDILQINSDPDADLQESVENIQRLLPPGAHVVVDPTEGPAEGPAPTKTTTSARPTTTTQAPWGNWQRIGRIGSSASDSYCVYDETNPAACPQGGQCMGDGVLADGYGSLDDCPGNAGYGHRVEKNGVTETECRDEAARRTEVTAFSWGENNQCILSLEGNTWDATGGWSENRKTDTSAIGCMYPSGSQWQWRCYLKASAHPDYSPTCPTGTCRTDFYRSS